MKARLFLLTALFLAGCASPKGGATKSTATTASGGSAAASMKSAVLSWTASAGSPSGYQVFQSTDGLTYGLAATVTTNSALVGSLTPGNTYYFTVRSFNAGGYSPTTAAIALHP